MDTSLGSTSTLSIVEASSEGDLRALEPEWAELYTRCPEATPFQSPSWLIPWVQHLAEGQVWVLALRSERRLVGIAPFIIHTSTEAAERQLFLLGIGNTDYLDVLVEPGLEDRLAETLFKHLQQHQDLWDVCDFQQLRPGSVLLTAEMPREWSSEVMVQEVCPVLPLGKPGANLRGVIPRHIFEKLSYYRWRLSRDRSAVIERGSHDNVDELFTPLLELHAARWGARGHFAAMAEARLQAFHRDVCQRFIEVGALRLYALRIDGRIVASLYAFASARRTFYYLSGFDPGYSALSPGSLVIGHAIEQAISEGCHEFDFLRGRESYKYMWGAKGRLNCRRRLRLTEPEFRRSGEG